MYRAHTNIYRFVHQFILKDIDLLIISSLTMDFHIFYNHHLTCQSVDEYHLSFFYHLSHLESIFIYIINISYVKMIKKNKTTRWIQRNSSNNKFDITNHLAKPEDLPSLGEIEMWLWGWYFSITRTINRCLGIISRPFLSDVPKLKEHPILRQRCVRTLWCSSLPRKWHVKTSCHS
jgi:hypothetical protein